MFYSKWRWIVIKRPVFFRQHYRMKQIVKKPETQYSLRKMNIPE